MKKPFSRHLQALAATLLLSSTAVGAQAADTAYPVKPVNFVTGVGAGSNNDTVLRMLAEVLRERWGQPVTVENKPGAVGIIGSTYVAKAPADGYTLLLTSTGSQIHNALLKKNLPYDPVGDFDPISLVAEGVYCFVVDAQSPYNTLQEYLEASGKATKELSFGSWGPGSATHLLGETLSQQVPGNLLHVPYVGEIGSLHDLAGGRLDSTWLGTGTAQAMAESGRVKILATTGAERTEHLPNIPTFKELGLDGMEVTGWIGIYAPKGTPQPVLAILERDINEALRTDGISNRIKQSAQSVVAGDGKALEARYARDYEIWRGMVERTGLKPE